MSAPFTNRQNAWWSRLRPGAFEGTAVRDVCHHHIYDPHHPEWFLHMDYDTDPQKGAEAKTAVFTKVVSEGLKFHGYHFPYPGIGTIVDHGDGTFRCMPDMLTPRL